MLAGGLPPLGDRPRGSRVWCDSLPVGEARPLLGNGPRGSRKGQYPLTPLRARWARGARGKAGWPGFYRRDTKGVTARGRG